MRDDDITGALQTGPDLFPAAPPDALHLTLRHDVNRFILGSETVNDRCCLPAGLPFLFRTTHPITLNHRSRDHLVDQNRRKERQLHSEHKFINRLAADKGFGNQASRSSGADQITTGT